MSASLWLLTTTILDIRDRPLMTLEDVRRAIAAEVTPDGWPDGLVVSPEQEAEFLREWRAWSGSEPAPDGLDGDLLWGVTVRVLKGGKL